jgi:hypothetical protein
MKPGDLVKFSWSTGSWIGLVIDLVRTKDARGMERERCSHVKIFRPCRQDVQVWSLAGAGSAFSIEVICESR